MFLMDKAIADFKKSELDKKQIKICLNNAIYDEDISNIRRYYSMLEELKLTMVNLADMIEYNQSLN